MERLTTWRNDKRAAIANNDGATPLQQTMKIPKVIDRLAAIEDILGDDYDLDRLRELVEADREGRCTIISTPKRIMVYENLECDIDVDRLRELVEADRAGRCVVLPVLPALSPGVCGSEIFILLDSGEIVEDNVCDIWIGLNNSGKLTLNFSTFDSDDFETADVGKRIFWDVEAAQQAASSLKGEQPC